MLSSLSSECLSLSVQIDANWDLPNRSASGDLVPDPSLYPSGLNHTVSYVHSLGLKFGLYGDRGTMDCGRAPGQQGHETHDGLWLGRHKIDWFKSDSCYTTEPGEPSKPGEVTAITQYEKLRDGFNASGYPVWWALCDGRKNPPSFYSGPDKYPEHPVGNALANSARIGPDTGGGWMFVMQNLENALPAQQVKKRCSHFCIKTNILPRQARDKHRETSEPYRFLAVCRAGS